MPFLSILDQQSSGHIAKHFKNFSCQLGTKQQLKPGCESNLTLMPPRQQHPWLKHTYNLFNTSNLAVSHTRPLCHLGSKSPWHLPSRHLPPQALNSPHSIIIIMLGPPMTRHCPIHHPFCFIVPSTANEIIGSMFVDSKVSVSRGSTDFKASLIVSICLMLLESC